ncbi:hypothetical protein OAP18_00220 [Gammaproteobacteria bacterium]|nr:hypothetical protein [Gammaproteobacteria bacterium]
MQKASQHDLKQFEWHLKGLSVEEWDFSINAIKVIQAQNSQ